MELFEQRLKDVIRREMQDMRVPAAPVDDILRAWGATSAQRRPAGHLVPWAAAAAAFVALLLLAASLVRPPVHQLRPATPAVTIGGLALHFPAKQLLFVSPETGFALGVENWPAQDTGPLVVYRTGDGGRSWSRVFQTPLTTAAPVALKVVGPSQVALVGLTGKAYVASDAGGPWRTVQLPGLATGADFVSFATPTVWYVLGDVGGAMGHDFGTVYRAGDAGATWRVMDRIPGAFPLTGISASTPGGPEWIGQVPPSPGLAFLIRRGAELRPPGCHWAPVLSAKWSLRPIPRPSSPQARACCQS